MYSSLAPIMAFAVSTMTGVSRFGLPTSAFMSRRVSIPSLPGIMWSKSMMSYLFFLVSSRQSFPLMAVSIFIPVFLRRLCTTFRFTSTSSTARREASGAVKRSSLRFPGPGAGSLSTFSSSLPAGVVFTSC